MDVAAVDAAPVDAALADATTDAAVDADAAQGDGPAPDAAASDAAADSPADAAAGGDVAPPDAAPDAPADGAAEDAADASDGGAPDVAGPWDPCAPGSLIDLNARGSLAGSVTRFVGDTSAAGPDNPLYCPCAPRTAYQVALRYVPRMAGALRVSTSNPGTPENFDTVAWAQDRCASLRPDMVPLGCNDDGSRAPLTRAALFEVPSVTAGAPVFLVVAGYSPPSLPGLTNRGPFELTVTEVPGVPAGAACDPTGGTNVCLAEGVCANVGGSSTCAAPGARGGRCRVGASPCDAGLACTGTGGAATSRCRATVLAGGACDPSQGSDVCVTGATCVTAGPSAVCVVDGQAGARCRTGGALCDAGLACDASSRCRVALATGAACDPARVMNVCATTASCVTQGGTSTCVAEGALGGRCRTAMGELPCNAGLGCVAGACRVTVGPGMPCDPADFARVCTAEYSCIAAGAGATCTADGTRGARCRGSSPRCDTSLECSVEGYCRAVTSVGGACDLAATAAICVLGSGCAPTSLTTASCAPLRAEVEPNNSPAAPQAAAGAAAVFGGSVELAGRDCYAVPVPAGGGLLAHTTVLSTPTCLGSGANTLLVIYDPRGVEIARNDDAPGRGLCSRVAPDVTPAVRGLSAGTYVVCVESANGGLVSDYRLAVGAFAGM